MYDLLTNTMGWEKELKPDVNDEYKPSKSTGRNGIPGRGTNVKIRGQVKRSEHD